MNSLGRIELENVPRIPKSSIILTGKDTAISLSGLITGRDVSTQNNTGIHKTPLQQLLKSNKLNYDKLLTFIYLFMKLYFLVPFKLWLEYLQNRQSEYWSSVHIFIVTYVRVISLHLSFNHRLLPSAAGHRQTNEESLKITNKAHIRKYYISIIWSIQCIRQHQKEAIKCFAQEISCVQSWKIIFQ